MAQGQEADTQRTIRDFIVTELEAGRRAGQIDFEDDLIRSGIIDSLGVQQIIEFIESRFAITVDDMDLVPENFETVTAIAALVEQRQAAVAGQTRKSFMRRR